MKNNKYIKRRIILLFFIIIFFTIVGYFEYQKSIIIAPESLQNYSNKSEKLASASLESLQIKERDSKTNYRRDQFGDGWQKINGCDMRNYILQRDLFDETLSNINNCDVLNGTLKQDPYTGDLIIFNRGPDTSDDVQIDHIVPLSDAWQKGAQYLTLEERRNLANDPLNLLAVKGQANQEKSDKDASNWLPEKNYRCQYVARQIAVKQKYKLWITKSEYNAIKRVLYTCPGQLLPVEDGTPAK